MYRLLQRRVRWVRFYRMPEGEQCDLVVMQPDRRWCLRGGRKVQNEGVLLNFTTDALIRRDVVGKMQGAGERRLVVGVHRSLYVAAPESVQLM